MASGGPARKSPAGSTWRIRGSVRGGVECAETLALSFLLSAAASETGQCSIPDDLETEADISEHSHQVKPEREQHFGPARLCDIAEVTTFNTANALPCTGRPPARRGIRLVPFRAASLFG